MRRLLILVLCGPWACADPVDRAAKARIFSAEDPPQAVAAASQPLPPERVADEPAIARRILDMSAAEVTERLGAFRSTATVEWEWQAGARTVRLKEQRELVQGPSGINGDFRVRISNSGNAGLEVLKVANRVYARNTFGADGEGRFRLRLRDRGMAERTRESCFGALQDMDTLFGQRMLLVPASGTATATVGARSAWRYQVVLGEPDQAAPGQSLPSPAFPRGGVDATTARRLHFAGARTPVQLEGEVLVDAESSVVLRARLRGRLRVQSDGGESADLRVAMESTLSDIGTEPKLAAPVEYLPDVDKPDGVAAALARFGIERKGSDGGTATADEPVDEDE